MDAVKNASSVLSPPKRFQREGLRVVKGAPKRVREKVDSDCQWSDFLEQLHHPVPKKRKQVKGYNKVISEKPPTKRQKKEIEKSKSPEQCILEKYQVSKLQSECQRLNLDHHGKKAELIERLLPHFKLQQQQNQ